MRIPFLILTPACVLLGAGTAAWSGTPLNLTYLVLAFIGALAAHISVNALNEYHDFKSGLDFRTQRTPFSGGSGTLPRNPEKAHYALIIGLVTLAVIIIIGIYFLYIQGLWLLPLGIFGLILVAAYTRLLTRNPFFCLIAPGLGFGVLMVMGTHFALTGSYSWTSFIASLVPFFLVSDLLLLNQFPDVEADREAGRRHILITMGTKAGVRVYGSFLAGAYAVVILGYFTGALPLAGFLALATLVLAIPVIRGAARYADDIPKLIPYLSMNVIIIIVTPVLLAIGLFIGR
ncbi:MAG: prenyltransferase [Deltaproteobacteria bacterium]|nr:prenyltransferase [Deltaproteobacteria bacterium]MBW2086467.1 prenyltransferase [Deltaproteobacteria bacterium]